MTQRTLLDGDTGQKFESNLLSVRDAEVAGIASAVGPQYFDTEDGVPVQLTNGAPSATFARAAPIPDPGENVQGATLALQLYLQFGSTVAAPPAAHILTIENLVWGTRTAANGSIGAFTVPVGGGYFFTAVSAPVVFSGGVPNPVAGAVVSFDVVAVGIAAGDTIDIAGLFVWSWYVGPAEGVW